MTITRSYRGWLRSSVLLTLMLAGAGAARSATTSSVPMLPSEIGARLEPWGPERMRQMLGLVWVNAAFRVTLPLAVRDIRLCSRTTAMIGDRLIQWRYEWGTDPMNGLGAPVGLDVDTRLLSLQDCAPKGVGERFDDSDYRIDRVEGHSELRDGVGKGRRERLLFSTPLRLVDTSVTPALHGAARSATFLAFLPKTDELAIIVGTIIEPRDAP